MNISEQVFNGLMRQLSAGRTAYDLLQTADIKDQVNRLASLAATCEVFYNKEIVKIETAFNGELLESLYVTTVLNGISTINLDDYIPIGQPVDLAKASQIFELLSITLGMCNLAVPVFVYHVNAANTIVEAKENGKH